MITVSTSIGAMNVSSDGVTSVETGSSGSKELGYVAEGEASFCPHPSLEK